MSDETAVRFPPHMERLRRACQIIYTFACKIDDLDYFRSGEGLEAMRLLEDVDCDGMGQPLFSHKVVAYPPRMAERHEAALEVLAAERQEARAEIRRRREDACIKIAEATMTDPDEEATDA